MINELMIILTEPQQAEYTDDDNMFLQMHVTEWLGNSESLKDSLTNGMLDKPTKYKKTVYRTKTAKERGLEK